MANRRTAKELRNQFNSSLDENGQTRAQRLSSELGIEVKDDTKDLSSSELRKKYNMENGAASVSSNMPLSKKINMILGYDLDEQLKKDDEEYYEQHPGKKPQNRQLNSMATDMITSKRSFYKPADMNQANEDMYADQNDKNSTLSQIADVYARYQSQDNVSDVQSKARQAADNLANASRIAGTMKGDYADIYSQNAKQASDYYSDIAKDMDNVKDVYGYYKNEEAYNKAKQENAWKEQYSGLSYDEVQKVKSKLSPDSEEYKFLDNYGVNVGYSSEEDYDKDINSYANNSVYNMLPQFDKETIDHVVDAVTHGRREELNGMKQEDIDLILDTYTGSYENGWPLNYGEDKDYVEELKRQKNLFKESNITPFYQNEIVDNADFEELKKYDPNSQLPESNSKEEKVKNALLKNIYDYINSRPSQIDEMWNFGGFALDVKNHGYAFATEEEIETFNYLYKTDPDKAYKYLGDMKTVFEKRRAQKESELAGEYYSEASVPGKILMSLGTIPYQLTGGIENAVDVASSAITGNDYDPYGNAQERLRYSQSVRQAGAKESSKVWGGEFLYNTGMSIGDTLVGGKIFGKAFTPILGSAVYQSVAQEMSDLGYSQKDAVTLAGASALAEMAFEYISLDNLLKTPTMSGKRQIFKAALRQAGVEGLEEVSTEIVDMAINDIIRGDYSDYEMQYKEYLKQGYSEEEARKMVNQDKFKSVALAFAGGALSGGVLGTVASSSDYFNKSTFGKNISDNVASDLVNLSLDNNSVSEEAKKIAEKYENNASQMSEAERSILFSEVSNSQKAEVENIVKNELDITDDKVISKAADVILSDVSDEEFNKKADRIKGVTAEELTQIKNDIDAGAYDTPIIDAVNNARTQISVEASKQRTTTMSKKEIKKNDVSIEEAYKNYEANINTSSDRAKYDGLKGVAEVTNKVTNATTYVNKFETVGNIDSAKVITKGGAVVPLSSVEFTDEKLGKLYTEISQVKSTALANAILENFTGQDNINSYVMAANVAYNAGRFNARLSGKTFDDFYNNKENAEVILSLGNTLEGAKAFLQRAYSLGENEALKEAKKAPKQKSVSFKKQENAKNIMDSDAKLKNAAATLSVAMQERINFVNTIENTTGKLDNQVFGSFDNGIVNISDNTSNEWNTIIHEAVMEKMKAENPDGYKSVVKAVYDYMIESKGQKYLQEQVMQYQEAYRKAEGKETSIEKIFDEYVNDFVAGIFSTDKGVKDLAKWVTNNRRTKAHSIFQGIIDLFDRIVKEVKSYLDTHKNMNLAAREGLRADKLHAQHIRDLVMDIMDEEGLGLSESDIKNEFKKNIKFEVNVSEKTINYNELEKEYGGDRYTKKISQDIYNWITTITPEDMKKSPGYFKLGKISEAFRSIGLKELSIRINKSKIGIIMQDDERGHVEITPEIMAQIPYLLKDPAFITSSLSKKDTSIVAFTDKIIDGYIEENGKINKVKMAVFLPIKVSNGKGLLDEYVLLSVYGRDKTKIQPYFDNAIFYYQNPNKKRTNNLVLQLGLQLPSSTLRSGSIRMLPKKMLGVNTEKPQMSVRVDVDSEGNTITKEQQDYFKDSTVRDENGNLMVMYHGTPNATFTEFRAGSYFTPLKWYADIYQNTGASSISVKSKADLPDTYKVYLDIKKPFDTRIPEVKKIWDEEYYRKWGTGTPLMESGLPDWTDGEDLIEFIEENELDFDGIIVDEGSVGGYGEEIKSRGFSWMPLSSEQVKNITNENPTKNKNINLSVNVPGLSVDTTGIEVWEELMQEEELKTAQSIIEEGAKTLKDIALDDKKINQIASQILKTNNSTYSKEDLSQSLKAVFAYMTDTADANYNVLLQVMKEVAKPVIENSKSTDVSQTYDWERVRNYLKGTTISLSPKQKQEVAYNYGSYDAFRRRIFGSAKIGDNGISLDSVWSELVDISGGRLDINESDTNQPQALLEMIDDLKPHAFNEYGMDIEHAAYDVALDIYRSYFELQDQAKNNDKVKESVQKLVDKQKEYRKKSEKRYKEALQEYKDQLKAEKNKNIAEIVDAIKNLDVEKAEALRENNDVIAAIIESEKKAYENKLEKMRIQNNEKIAQIKAKNAESRANQQSKAKNTKLRQFVNAEINDLNKWLKSPNKDGHIKNSLVRPTIELLEAIDVDTGRSKGLKEKLDKLRDMYDSYNKDSQFDFDYDESTSAMIREMQLLFTGRNITQLTNEELDKVLEIVKRLKKQIRNANMILQNEKLKEANEATRGIVSEIRNSFGTNNNFTRTLDNYADLHLNAKRWFRKISGYKDGYMMSLYDQIDKGQMKKISIEKDINNMFSPVLDGKENQKKVKELISADKKSLVDVGLRKMGTEEVAMITKEMRLSLLMHSQNINNMRHVLFGGLTVPDMELYSKGKYKEAYDKGDTYHLTDYTDKIRKAAMEAAKYGKPELVEMAIKDASKDLQNKIFDSLSDYEKAFLKISETLFHDYTGKQINTVSNELKGYSLAQVKNYFPIKTDPDFTKIEFAGLIRDGSLEGMGFLKSRVNAKNQILLEGISKVILRQTDNVSRYVGLAIPVRNVNMLVAKNVYNDNGVDSIKYAIRKKWGYKNVEWFQNLMQDVQGGRKKDSSIFDSLRSKFAGATLTLNPSVAIKQTASYITAAAVVGYTPLLKATKDLGNGFISKKGLTELENINPLLWYRNKGNSTQELGDIKEKSDFGSKLPMFLNWIQWMDTGTVRTLEYASKYFVDSKFKELEKGSEEYWNKVSEIFTKVVEETQPNYTVMQQADIIRNPNKFVKQIFMFKTQPMQNFGIVYDAAGEFITRMKDKDASVEDKKKSGANLARAVSSQLASAAVFSSMTILAGMLMHKQYKYRKDDEDKISDELIIQAFLKGMRDTIIGAFTFGSEAYSIYSSIFKGEKYYGIEVSTLETINNLVTYTTYMQAALENYQNAVTDADRELYKTKLINYGIKLIGNVGTVAGVPVNNIVNDFKAIYLYGKDAVDGVSPGTSTIFYEDDVESQMDRVMDALISGDSDEYQRLRQQLVDVNNSNDPEKQVNENIVKQIKERYLANELSDEQVISFLSQFGYDENDIYFQLDKWKYNSQSDYAELYIQIDELINTGAEERSDVISTCKNYIEHGKDASNIISTVTKKYRPLYMEATGAEKATIKSVLITVFQSLGMTRKEANKKISEWK